MTAATLDPRSAITGPLRPRFLNRDLPLNEGEQLVATWLRELGLKPVHERWFYPFWIDQQQQPHGFRLDFTLHFEGHLLGVEVCEAGRYLEPPAGSNLAKWLSPEQKFQDKRDKIELLARLHGVSCALVTDAHLQAWQQLELPARRQAVNDHLAAASRLVPACGVG